MRDQFNWAQTAIYIPEEFRNVPYVYRAWPIWQHIENVGGYEDGFPNGANCHHWANELLRYYGYAPKDMFSDDMHKDTATTAPITDKNKLQCLDLVMVNRQNRAYGSHIGVIVGSGLIAHLSRENEKPVLVSLDGFIAEYGYFIGAKRCLAPPAVKGQSMMAAKETAPQEHSLSL